MFSSCQRHSPTRNAFNDGSVIHVIVLLIVNNPENMLSVMAIQYPYTYCHAHTHSHVHNRIDIAFSALSKDIKSFLVVCSFFSCRAVC